MHGGGQTRHAWGNTAEVLARRGWRAVSLDLRGHGDSEWALNGDYSFMTYAADCIAVCDQLGRPPVLVGASLGGVTAILAEGASARVVSTGLVLVDITHRTNPAGVQRIRDFMASGLGGFATLRLLARRLPCDVPSLPAQGRARLLRLPAARPPRPAEEVRRAGGHHCPAQAELLHLRDQRGPQGAHAPPQPDGGAGSAPCRAAWTRTGRPDPSRRSSRWPMRARSP